MTNVAIYKVVKGDKQCMSVFEDAEKALQRIRERAFECFQARASKVSLELSDWLNAERDLSWPSAECAETKTGYLLSVELPGFEPADLRVTVTGAEIAIRATLSAKASDQKEPERRVRWSEFRAREVCRAISMPGPIDVEKVSATMVNGMLQILAPRAAVKAIPVPIANAA